MYQERMFHLILIVIISGVNCNSDCDCNTITALQEFVQKKFFQIKLENSRIAGRLKRIEASIIHSSTTNYLQSNTAPDHNLDQSVSKEKPTTNLTRIDEIESTLTRVLTLLKLKTKETVQDDGQEQRLDKFETELATVSNKIEKIIDVYNFSKSVVLNFDSTFKKTFRGEKNNRVKFELDIKEDVRSVKNYCHNVTGETEKVIDQLKNEVFQKHEKFKEEMISKATTINQTVIKYMNDVDSSFDNLQNEITETLSKLSNLENATMRGKAEGGWSNWGKFGKCSVSCGVGVKVRSRICPYQIPTFKGQYCEGSPVHIAICNKNTCPENKVFFTAYNIQKAGSNAIFSKIYQNYGGGYDYSTGKFICKVPGIYMFSFQISKEWDVKTDRLYCYLLKNSNEFLGAEADPHGDERDGYSISVTGTVYLSKNDVVHVGSCRGVIFALPGKQASFTGVLITPDNNQQLKTSQDNYL